MQGKSANTVLCIAGPTASGKSARAVEEALARGGEVISVDSRQVYRGLDIGTEKTSREEMRGVPHHLIDILDAREPYGAGDFVADATRLTEEIRARGALPILAGGTHFYFDALLHGLPEDTPPDFALRSELENISTEELYARVSAQDPRRAAELDPANRRRLVRALEIVARHGSVPFRNPSHPQKSAIAQNSGWSSARYEVEWIVLDVPREELRARIDARLADAFRRGLVEEVRRVRQEVGDARLNELGLEYRVVGAYLRGERTEASLIPALSAKLWHFARRQKAWLAKLALTPAAP
jgi:tRNA dimethylallyltransferase